MPNWDKDKQYTSTWWCPDCHGTSIALRYVITEEDPANRHLPNCTIVHSRTNRFCEYCHDCDVEVKALPNGELPNDITVGSFVKTHNYGTGIIIAINDIGSTLEPKQDLGFYTFHCDANKEELWISVGHIEEILSLA